MRTDTSSSLFVDASVLVAVITEEPESQAFMEVLLGTQRRLTSPVALLETAIAVTRKLNGDAPAAQRTLDDFVERLAVEVVPVDAEVGRIAREAWSQYGRGSGHPAKLNLGDCLAYACARCLGLPLLFKGEDFVHTDAVSAVFPTKR